MAGPSPPEVDRVVAALDGFSLEQCGSDPTNRLAVLEAARDLIARLQTPFEQMFEWSSVGADTVCQIIRDLGLWERWREAGGRDASLKALWELCKPCDISLLRRLLRFCTGARIVKELGEDLYGATPTSLALGIQDHPVNAAVDAAFPYVIDPLKRLPDYLARHHWENPDDPHDTCYMETSPGYRGLYDSWAEEPALQKSFLGLRVGTADMRPDWTDIYDTNSLVEGFDVGRSDTGLLLVDIGGAQGDDVERLLSKQPQIPKGRIVIEDLPSVVATVDLGDGVRCVGHDFFKPQPDSVSGARAYLLHSILRDWNDEDCRLILDQLVRVMKPGHSRLLVCDVVMPATGASLYQAGTDIALMYLLSACERVERQWTELLRSAGLEVVKVWRHRRSPECVIEAELAGEHRVGEVQKGRGN